MIEFNFDTENEGENVIMCYQLDEYCIKCHDIHYELCD